MRNAENFDNVQVGDEVIYSSNWNGWALGKVTKVTPKQFCVGARRFRKEDGLEVAKYSVRRCYHATEEDKQEIWRKEHEREVNHYLHTFFCLPQNLRYLNIEDKEAIQEIVKRATTPKQTEQ